MPDEQQMEPSEAEQTEQPAPAAEPRPTEAPEQPQPTEQGAQPPAPAEQATQPESAEAAEQGAQPEPAEHDAPPAAPARSPAPAADDAPEPDSSPAPDTAPPDADAYSAGGPSLDDADDAGAGDPSLDEVIRERDEHRDRWVRVTAEFANYRKRTERKRRELVEQAAGDLLGDLLPVVDDIENALAADTQDGESYRRGVEGIHRKLFDVMARRGVAPIKALGADFDPNLHQAVTYESGDGHRDGEVVEELRRGYTLRQRLLRPSMVKVAKA